MCNPWNERRMETADNKKKALSPQEQKDEEMISAAFQHLLDTYLASNHRRKVDIITKAFNFAKEAHKGVRRRSGEPYILPCVGDSMPGKYRASAEMRH